MPACGEKGAPPKFKGSYEDVKRFLARYNDVTYTYGCTSAQKCDRVIDYCSHKVRRLVESLKSFTIKDWTQLEADFLKYFDADRKETRYIIRDLTQLTKKWKHRPIKTMTRWKRYERKFMTIAGWLLEKGKINEDEQAAYFWHGICRSLRKDIENRLLMKTPQPSLIKAYNMQEVIKVAEQLFERDRFDYNLADSDSDLPDWDEISSDSSDDETDTSDSESEYKKSLYKKKHHRKKKSKKTYDSDTDSELEKIKKSTKTKQNSYKASATPVKTKDSKKIASPTPTSSPVKNSGQNEVEQLIKQMGRISIDDPHYALMY